MFIHTVLEGFAAINEHNRNLIVELSPELIVGVDVNFAPGESAAALKLGEAFLYHFTQMTAFARINDDAAELWHARKILARRT